MKDQVRSMVYGGLFIAVGVILPQVFHMIGAGNVFLPMHIPVLLCGFFVGWSYALAVGALTPLLSFLVTGMPPIPMLYIMMFELSAYGALVSLLRSKLKANEILKVYASLAGAMVGGRIVACLVTFLLSSVFGLGKFSTFLAWITTIVAPGLPGIALQLLFIPAIVLALWKIVGERKYA